MAMSPATQPPAELNDQRHKDAESWLSRAPSFSNNRRRTRGVAAAEVPRQLSSLAEKKQNKNSEGDDDSDVEDDVDPHYRMFLENLREDGGSYTLEIEMKNRMVSVKYEGEDDSKEFDDDFSFDSEALVTKNASDFKEGGCNPLQTSKLLATLETEQQCLGSRGVGTDLVFREKLMAILGKPYDDGEYKKLWNEIKEEKPREKHYNLRGSGVKTFRRSELGPSYLAKHAGLRKKIKAVGNDRRKKLYYLRGFFFWLQNVAHEDSFQPWNDKSCLEVMSKSC